MCLGENLMREDVTDITVLVDRSGSMYSIKYEMEKAFQGFLKEQKNIEGKCKISLYSFDGRGYAYPSEEESLCLEEHYINKSIKRATPLVINPRGNTPLRDAIVTVLQKTKKRIKRNRKERRPGRVIILVITDGYENASMKYSAKDVQREVKSCEKDNWKFIYFGANQDAIKVGRDLGIRVETSVTYAPTSKGIKGSFDTITDKISTARCCSVKDYNMVSSMDFDEEEREKCMGLFAK